MNNCEKAIEILSKTNDGRDLYQSPENIERHGANGDGWQLTLTQDAVNNMLSAKGKTLFDCLYAQVLAGDYKYALFEFITKFCPDLRE